MNSYLSKEEEYLLELLSRALSGKPIKEKLLVEGVNIQQVINMAKKHAVLSLLYDELPKETLTEEQSRYIEKECKQISLQNYRLLFLTKYVVGLLEENELRVVVLKGVSTAKYYPVPELRKSGDVDLLLLDTDKIGLVKQILLTNGFKIYEEQLANHHISFLSEEGISIEIHTMLAEPFDNGKINRYLDKMVKDKQLETDTIYAMELELPVLSKAYYAYELLLHMMQHFLRSGFGLKLLCDWVVFWQYPVEENEKSTYLRLLEESRVKGFSDLVTQVCVKYLGMPKENVQWMNCMTEYPCEEFMKEVIEAEEFGKSEVERMVVLQGTGLMDFFKEFHHQMYLNYPKVGKCFLLWPVLWIMTLLRFLRNNKKVRNTSTAAIIKEAKRRSGLMKQLKLFQ